MSLLMIFFEVKTESRPQSNKCLLCLPFKFYPLTWAGNAAPPEEHENHLDCLHFPAWHPHLGLRLLQSVLGYNRVRVSSYFTDMQLGPLNINVHI